MRIVFTKSEKKKLIRLSRKDKRVHLKMWRFMQWFKRNYERIIKEIQEAIGE